MAVDKIGKLSKAPAKSAMYLTHAKRHMQYQSPRHALLYAYMAADWMMEAGEVPSTVYLENLMMPMP